MRFIPEKRQRDARDDGHVEPCRRDYKIYVDAVNTNDI